MCDVTLPKHGLNSETNSKGFGCQIDGATHGLMDLNLMTGIPCSTTVFTPSRPENEEVYLTDLLQGSIIYDWNHSESVNGTSVHGRWPRPAAVPDSGDRLMEKGGAVLSPAELGCRRLGINMFRSFLTLVEMFLITLFQPSFLHNTLRVVC